MENTVSIHKKINRSALKFFQEISINFFSEIMKRWNNQQEYKELIFTKKEIKRILKLQNLNYLEDFLVQFSKETVGSFKIEDDIIIGNVFSFVISNKKNIVEVHLHNKLIPYLFTKRDIEYMKKNKRKVIMQPKEIEEYDKNKKKYKELMIFSQTDLLNIKSKFIKRLYMLLIQFRKSGLFYMNYEEFREVLEIPAGYKSGHIEKRILEKAQEKLKSVRIFISRFELEREQTGHKPVKKVSIYFKYKEEIKETKKAKEIKEAEQITKSLAEEYNMPVEERNKIGLDGIKLAKEIMEKSKKSF